MYLLPSCVATAAMNLNGFTGKCLTVTNFAYLPSTINSILLSYSNINSLSGTTSTSSEDGFNSDGTINWTEFFARFTALTNIAWSYSAITGSLPTAISNNILQMQITRGSLSGTIPATLLPTAPSFNQLIVSFAYNKLTGNIPAELFAPLQSAASLTTLNLDFSGNSLDGTIPEQLLRPGSTTSFTVVFESNSLTGTLPASLFKTAPTLSSFYVDFSANLLTGTLPASFFNAGINAASNSAVFNLKLASNGFTGSIPSGFITAGLNQNITFNSFQLDLHNNHLEGTIPDTLLTTYVPTKRDDLATESTRENVDSKDFMAEVAVSIGGSQAQLYLQTNKLTGTIPSSLMDFYRPDNGFSNGGNYLSLTSNLLTGSLPARCSSTKALSLQISNNKLIGTIPTEWTACMFNTIQIGSNANISGSIPSGLLTASTLQTFEASSTSLTGDLPAMKSGLSLQLSSTKINFCSANSLSAVSLVTFSSCILVTAPTCGCESSYSPRCSVSTCPPSSTPSPTASTPAPLGCSGTPPSSSFNCINGAWTAEVVSSETLVIPPNSGTVIVTGNMTSSSVVLNDLSSTIEVLGCATNLTQLHIELTKEQVEKLGKTKLYQLLSTLASNCSTTLDDVSMSVSVKNGGCRKVSVSKVSSADHTTLSGLFTMDNSSCKTWWIILVSVLAGVIVLIFIVLILLAIFCKSFRVKVRPYSSARQPAQQL